MKKNELIGSKLLIEQIKSSSKLNKSQKSSLYGLGLGKIGSQVQVDCTSTFYGMIRKVFNLLKITKV